MMKSKQLTLILIVTALMLAACGKQTAAIAPAATQAASGQEATQAESAPTESSQQPSEASQDCGTDSGEGCAPASERVDLTPPTFSNPTSITNPLFPIKDLHSVILLGNVDGHLMRTETTLLPKTEVIEWNGQKVETLVSQYVAYLDGRIEEIAIDRYAQADDGSVWYFGEDVSDFKDGVVVSTEGTWLAGKDGPPAMIMPANPQVGDVYRSENIPGNVFEEVTVKEINVTVDGPHGPVTGAMVGEELHMDGSTEDKIFAPGYGEFWTGSGGDLEALALAAPTDTLSELVPAELDTLTNGALDIFNAAEAEDWDSASATLESMNTAWEKYQASGNVPPLLAAHMSRALQALAGDALIPAVNAHNVGGARRAAVRAALASRDLELQYRTPTEIDRARFDLWVRQLLVDAAGTEPGPVLGDVRILELIWDRIGHTYEDADASRIEAALADLRTAADNEDLEAASKAAGQLEDILASVKPKS